MNMKKSLLIAVAAFFVAVGANAQYVRVAQKAQWLDVPSNVKMENVMTRDYTPYVKTMKATRRADAASLAGEYILNAANFDNDFTASTPFEVVSETGSITLDMYEGAPFFDYNVVLKDFSYTGAVAYAKYYEEDNIIEIPVQTIYTHATYKEIVISGGYRSGETSVGYGREIYLYVNEDGTMDIVDPVEEDAENPTTGWVSFLPNYEDGGLWNYGFDIAVLKPNATMYYTTTGKSLGGTGSWTKVEKRVAVEDYDTELVINGFLGLAPISVTLNGDGTCAIPFGQDLDDYDYGEYDTSYEYGRMRLVGCVIDGNSIMRDYDKAALNGFYDETGMDFYLVEYKEAWTDEDGEHEAGYYYVDDNPDYCRYYAVATASGPEGAYSLGWCCNTWVEYDADPTGINEISTSRKESGKTYNVMGQQVGANAKGLIIRDGKKFVVK